MYFYRLTVQLIGELLKLLNDESETYALRVSAAELIGKGFQRWGSCNRYELTLFLLFRY